MAGNLKINTRNNKSIKIGSSESNKAEKVESSQYETSQIPLEQENNQFTDNTNDVFQSNQQKFDTIYQPIEAPKIPTIDSGNGLYDDYKNSQDEQKESYLTDSKNSTIDDKKLSKKEKKLKREKEKKDKRSKDKNGEPLTIEAAYSAYKVRKIILYTAVIGSLVLVSGFGAYNVFFKHSLTEDEAISATNKYNNQAKSQQWDSGVQSFLQENLYNLLLPSFKGDGDSQKFSVDNISVERNTPYGEDMFLTFFSADIINGDKTERIFGEMFISVDGSRFSAASQPSITARKAYSKGFSEEENKKRKEDGESVVDVSKNKYLMFEDSKLNDKESKAFESTLNNFLTLGYNSKQDVSDIYKGNTPLDFNGTFVSIDSCSVYDEPNDLGFNAVATYIIKLDNLSTFKTTSYYKISKNSSDSYNIDMIL